MVKTSCALLLLLCGLGLPARAAPPPSDSPGASAAQDATGTVWALPIYGGGDGTLQRWQAEVWSSQTIPGAAGLRPRALTRGADGSVYALWQRTDQGQPGTPSCLVTVQRGVGSRVLASLPGPVVRDQGFPSTPTIYAGVGGDVWVAGCQPLLWHVAPDGSVATFPLKPEQYFGGTLPGDFDPQNILSLVDGAGRRWFWQDGSRGFFPRNGLRGVLIWNGKALTDHPTLPGVPDQPISTLAPLDAGHFWLGAGMDYRHRPLTHASLYRVDTETLTAVPEALPTRPETPPGRGIIHSIIQVFRANGDWYAVDQGPNRPEATLWRKRGGQWRPCLDTLEEMGGYYGPGFRHPWLAEPSGVWIGVIGGAWWVPRDDQPPVWVNWRRGLAVTNIGGLFPQADGGILAVSDQGGAALMPPTPQPVRPLPPGVSVGGMGAPKGLGPLAADPRHHLWATPAYSPGPRRLKEWDGRRWQTHLTPPSIPGVGTLFACDSLGRLWLSTSNWHPPAQAQPAYGYAVYDPAQDRWTNYDIKQDALAAAAAQPGMAFLPYKDTYEPPLFSGDGRVTYADSTTIFLYDGKTWRQWRSGEILSGYGGNVPSRLQFNSQGHLELTLDVQVCEWTPETGWQRVGEEKQEKYVDPVPPGGPHGLWMAPVMDDLGRKWFVWNGAVYTAAYGLWAKQNELSGFGSPFLNGCGIEDVRRDPEGRLFFLTRPGGYYDLVVWSPPPAPRPALAVVPLADDSVGLRVRAEPAGPYRLIWRLNGGEWSAPRAVGGGTTLVKLTGLPPGDYRAEVQVLDPLLTPSTPCVAVFSIRSAPNAQVARWVRTLLSGTEEAREYAVGRLVRQPDAALPALRAARPGASEAGRWWVDAAIQQITEQERGGEREAE